MTHSPIRYREDGWEYRCETCRDWWPLSLEFWRPRNGMVRCRTCWTLYKRLRAREYTADVAVRAVRNEANRARYRANRESHIEAGRAWRARHRERIPAHNLQYPRRNR